jgi:hypothetical protein
MQVGLYRRSIAGRNEVGVVGMVLVPITYEYKGFFSRVKTNPIHGKVCSSGCTISSLTEINEEYERSDSERPKRSHVEGMKLSTTNGLNRKTAIHEVIASRSFGYQTGKGRI